MCLSLSLCVCLCTRQIKCLDKCQVTQVWRDTLVCLWRRRQEKKTRKKRDKCQWGRKKNKLYRVLITVLMKREREKDKCVHWFSFLLSPSSSFYFFFFSRLLWCQWVTCSGYFTFTFSLPHHDELCLISSICLLATFSRVTHSQIRWRANRVDQASEWGWEREKDIRFLDLMYTAMREHTPNASSLFMWVDCRPIKLPIRVFLSSTNKHRVTFLLPLLSSLLLLPLVLVVSCSLCSPHLTSISFCATLMHLLDTFASV